MFWIVEKLGGYTTDLETFIATYLLVLSTFALIGLYHTLMFVWSFL
ncbi:hypothetical protein Cp1R7AA1_147 [Mesorhizobium phage Cp1R7A-A1]|nr:hypothetical protein Cp1R7AA1_147 [Mesorhizobium phage Cp1R7A-A1]